MRVAVTGASGFVGRHVLAALRERAVRATAAGHSRSVESSYHQTVSLDLHDDPDPYSALGRPDLVIHLAWGGLPNYASAHHVDDELPAHMRMLDRLVTSGVTRLVVTGTCFEYGLREGALAETDPPRPANSYAIAKDQLRRFLETHELALTWARLFYLYGPGQAPSSLYSQLAAADGGSLDMSSGDQLRDYLPIETAAAILVRLALDHPAVGIVNVCSGQPATVHEMALQWICDNGWTVALNLGARPPSPFEPKAFWGDRRKLDEILGPEDASPRSPV